MFDYRQLEALATVAAEQSFHRAAKKLHVTQSAISQRIRSLEQTVGRPLLIRSQPLRPTAWGQRLISHFHLVGVLEGEVQSSWKADRPNAYRPIPIALNTESLSTWFLSAVQSFLQKNNVVLELSTEDQDRTIRMLGEGAVLGCVTSIKNASAGCRSVPIGKMVYRCVATPQFMRRFFIPRVSMTNLQSAPAAIFGRHDDLHHSFLKKHFRQFEDMVPTYTYIPSAEGLLDVTSRGLAYSLLPELSVKRQLEKGSLVDVLPKKSHSLQLFWHTNDTQAPLIEELSEYIVNYCRKPGSGLH